MTTDAKAQAALAARARAAGLPEWQKEMSEAVPTAVIRDLVLDARRSMQPSSMIPSKPAMPSSPAAQTSKHGWIEPPQVRDWTPPGQRAIDAMLDAVDAADRAERAKKFQR